MLAGAIVFGPEFAAVGGLAGVAIDAAAVAMGGLMFYVGETGRQQAADDLAEEMSHNKGAKGNPETGIKPGDKTPKGREYTQHGAERANERGFDSQKVDSIIDNNYQHRTKEIDKLTGKITWRYQDRRGNTVITNEWGDKIVTVYSYPTSANGGNYIPKN